MRRSITDLKGAHRNGDVWVLGSGPSLGLIEPGFWHGKVVLGVNDVWRFAPCTYTIRKEQLGADAAAAAGPLVISDHDWGCYHHAKNQVSSPHWMFEHAHNEVERVDWSVLGGDRLAVGCSTTISALHLAAYLGAANIVMCGCDCGTIDGRRNVAGYYGSDLDESNADHDAIYREWLRKVEVQTLEAREQLRRHYGVRIYSLNPFINLGMEGKNYER